MLRPVVSYACQIFGGAADSHIKKIQTLQNKTLRMIAKAPWYFRNDDLMRTLATNSISSFYFQVSDKFYNRLPDLDNEEIAKLPIYDIFNAANKNRPRTILKRIPAG